MQASLWASYIKEREDKEMIETDFGFVVYSIHGEECFAEEVYVKPEFRGKGKAYALGDMLTKCALENQCKYLTATVIPSKNGATQSLQAALAFGGKIHSAHENKIVLIKEL